MRLPRTSIPVLILVAVGCGRTPRVDNPVFGPAPPRVSLNDEGLADDVAYVSDPLAPGNDREPGDLIRTVSVVGDDGFDPGTASDSKVVARVNGEPIFEGDVLEPYAGQIAKNRDQVSDAQFEQLKRMLLERDLDSHVDRKLLVHALKDSMPAEGFTEIRGRLESVFEEEAATMREKQGVKTNYELDLALRAEGQSLDAIRRSFVNQQLAMVYMGQNAQREFEIGRADLLDYYERNRKEYEIEAKVRWQRLQVKFSKHGGKSGALDVLQQAVADLREGTAFEDVIRSYSDGPRGKTGGYKDWTRRGELRDKAVEAALFGLPENKLSRVFEDGAAFQIVMVLERQEDEVIAFEEVQEEIQLAVENELRKKSTDRILSELKSTAEIWTVLDDEKVDTTPALPFE